jgi:4'-phosphopantetheinyl transferase
MTSSAGPMAFTSSAIVRAFGVGRGVLRALIGRYLGITPARVRFEYGRWGKPRLAGALSTSGLRFNAAHSDGLFLAAFTPEQEIGIDLERVVPVPEMLQIAELAFSPAEHASLCALPAEARTQAFFDCWTHKEVRLKAGGDGMVGPRGRSAVHPAKGERRGHAGPQSQGGAEDRWSIHAFTPAPEYVAALAVEGPLGPMQRGSGHLRQGR